MFIMSCKYVSHSPVKKSVDSILKHHPNEKIVIVDSQSDNHDYHKFFSNYDTVEVLYDINIMLTNTELLVLFMKHVRGILMNHIM